MAGKGKITYSKNNFKMVLRQLTKEQAKEEVKKLVDKYNRIIESGSIKRYKEEIPKK